MRNRPRFRRPVEYPEGDCLAGGWAHTLAQRGGILETGEIREALDAAAAVGDDRIQEKTTGMINGETWTHGSSEERVAWFTTGYETGNADRCDTVSRGTRVRAVNPPATGFRRRDRPRSG